VDEERRVDSNDEYQDQQMVDGGSGGINAFFSRAASIFISPSRVFADIERGRVSWWQPFIWFAVINMVVAYLSIPITLAVTRLNPNNLPQETLQDTVEKIEQFGLVGVVLTPVLILIMALIVSMIGYILVSIMSADSSFKKFFTLFMYSTIVASLTSFLSVIIVRFFRGVETIRSTADGSISFGLGFLAPPDNRFLEAIFKSFDLFSIWSLVLVAMGLIYIFKMTRNQAIICVIPLWLIGVVMLVIGSLFGNA
jgi:hypothetical protein